MAGEPTNGHLTVAICEAALRGDLSPEELTAHLVRHVAAICPDCRRTLQTIRDRLQAGDDVAYDTIFSRLIREAGAMHALRSQQDTAAGERLYRALLRIPAAERATRIQRCRTKYLSYGLCIVLLRESLRAVHDDPGHADHLISLAHEVTCRLVYGNYAVLGGRAGLVYDLRGLVAAHRGNVFRVTGRFQEAEKQFQTALSQREQGTGDPLVLAQVLDLYASLLRDLRQFDRAVARLEAAKAIYEEIGEEHKAGRSLMCQAAVWLYAGDARRAVTTQRKALRCLDAAEEPGMVVAAEVNLALYMTEAGNSAEALRRLQGIDLAALPADRIRTHYRWILGITLTGLGRDAEATGHLERARTAFIEAEDAHDVALASIYLALVHFRLGRHETVRRLALESFELLRSMQLSADATAAFLLFKQAVEAQTVTLQLLRDVEQAVKKAPRLRRSDATTK